MPDLFASESLKLRALEPEDLDWLYEVENDASLWPWGTSNVPYSRYVLKSYIAGTANDIYADGQLRLVAQSADGTVAGCVDLMNFDARHLRAEVGLLVLPEYRGKGTGRKMLHEVSVYAREFLFLHQLYAIVSEHNFPACRLFESAGFQCTAEMKDWLHESSDGRYVTARLYQSVW